MARASRRPWPCPGSARDAGTRRTLLTPQALTWTVLGLAGLGTLAWLISFGRTFGSIAVALRYYSALAAGDEGVPGDAAEAKLISYPHPRGTDEPCRILKPVRSNRHRAIILYHGASPYAEEHPAINQLGQALALMGLTVYIPRLPRLKALHIDGSSGLAMAAAYQHICISGAWRPRQVSLVGTSFAGGLLLKSLAEDDWGSIAPGAVMTFGSYCNLETALRFVLTGQARFGKVSLDVDTDPWGQIIFFYNYLEYIERPFDLEAVREVLTYYVTGEEQAGLEARQKLAPREAAIMEAILESSSAAAAELAEEIMIHARPVMSAYSPASFVGQIRHPVWVLHGQVDRLVPYTEALALKALLGRRAKVHIAGRFGHKEAEGDTHRWGRIKEELGMVFFMTRFLRAAPNR